MDTLTRAQYAAHHGKSDRTVQRWLAAGLIPGAVQTRDGWQIPADALPLFDDPGGRSVATSSRAVTTTPPPATLAAALDVLPAYLDVDTAARLLGLKVRTVARNPQRWDGERLGGDNGQAWMIPAAAVRKVAGL
jgi:hypothetical protein